MVLQDPAYSFFSSRPEWTLNEALIVAPDGRTARVTQAPFAWSEGAWAAALSIIPIEPRDGEQTIIVTLRITPDTLRRWKDVSINPFLEARAQLQEHWRSAHRYQPGTLTLL